MKRFNFKLFFFILPIIIFAFLLEFALRMIPNDYVYKKELLDKGAHQIETLILGNSHIYTGLNPTYLENKNAFNAAYFSQTLYFDNEIFKKYQDQTPQLKTVIISVSYASLFYTFGYAGDYFLYWDFDVESMKFFDKTEILGMGKTFSANMKRVFRYYIKRESPITSTELGWGNFYKSEESKNLLETGKETAKKHEKNMDLKMVDTNVDLINSIINTCKQRNIHVLLITMPTYQSYRDNINNEYLNIALTTAGNIAQKHENCTYLNLHEDASFVVEDFYDGDHLNDIGAKKLSLLVNKTLDEIINK